jgi:hypothetical protein
VADPEFFELKRNPQQTEKTAPEAAHHVVASKEFIYAEIDQDQRPKKKYFVRLDESELIKQKNSA